MNKALGRVFRNPLANQLDPLVDLTRSWSRLEDQACAMKGYTCEVYL